MARPKAFEREQALDHAMHLFWKQGYEATSLPELLNTMSIGRQSLYDTFGGKHQLFMESLTRYREMIWATLADLQSPNASLGDIQAWFSAMIEFFGDAPHRRACFLINCTMELAPHDDKVAGMVREHYQVMEDAMLNAVQRCVARGEMEVNNAKATARTLLSTALGMGVYSKSGHSRQSLEDIAGTVIGCLVKKAAA